MASNVLISLIVPVYNSENFLGAAIESVLGQTFRDFELILVNDGSTDNSEQVCKDYAERDSRIKLISKPNGGLCSARNAGIDAAVGKYIMFMDNDDEIAENSLSAVWDAVEKYNADIIRFNRKRIQIFDDESTKVDYYGTNGICDDYEAHYFTREEFFDNYSLMRNSGCFAGIWNGAYRRELFSKIRFDTEITAGGEDNLVNILLYNIFSSVVFIPDVLYTYFRRTSHSISTAFETNHFKANIKCATAELKLIEKAGLPFYTYYHSAMIYLAVSIKVMLHKNSTLSRETKFRILDKLRSMRCFSFDKQELLSAPISVKDKAYLYMFTVGAYDALLAASKVIFAARGNV